MTRMLAARLSRALVGCYPRRWRQRYASELLDVLDQHRAGARTVLNLVGGAVSTHLDPAYRMEGLTMARFRRTALISAAVVVPLVLIAVLLGLYGAAQDRKDSHWHIGIEGGVDSMAFSPADQHVLVTATSGAMDGLDTLWNVADLSKPARITTLRTGDSGRLWGEAFSPDGHILAAAYTDRLFLWDVTDPARPRLLRTLAAPVVPPAPAACGQPCQAPDPFYQGDIAFSPDGRLLASTAGHDQVALWNVRDPAGATRIATVPSESGFIDALAFSPRGNLLAGVSYDGTVTMFNLADPARPARAATIQTVTAGQIAASACTGGCAPMYTLEFAPGGRALTAIVSLPSPPVPPAQVARDYVFEWNVTSPRSVTRTAVFSRSVATSPADDSSMPLLAPDGRTLAAGAPFSSFGVTLWMLP